MPLPHFGLRSWFIMVSCVASTLALGMRSTQADDVESDSQLPNAMHIRMEVLPTIRVGVEEGDLRGSDNRALQAAVDYVAGLGGGTVQIGPGTFEMHDSLHLRANVTVQGEPGLTILRKAPARVTPLTLDGDFGEQQFTVQDAAGIGVGQGVAIWDNHAHGFHTTVARITGQKGSTFSIDKPLMADCLVSEKAMAATLYPVVSGYDTLGVVLRGLTIEGNKEANAYLDGCRGGGIFLYRAFGARIENCVVRNYNGDGISFQQSNDVVVTGCTCEGNSQLGLHPGSGSQRPTIRDCVARNNGTDGLFLCWRVRFGVFENNLLENNGRFGISIGHKDTDNLLQKNLIRRNGAEGVFFRNESAGMAAHRNRLVANTIEDNGQQPGTAGIRVRGATEDLHFENNIVRDTRDAAHRTQTTGVLIEAEAGAVSLDANQLEASEPVIDQR